MKFISWNVNGLRACIQKGFLAEFNQFDADFFCLQETKLSEGQLELDLPGYEQYWCYAEKKGYSGTAIFTKHTPQSVHYGLDVPELDNEGRLITLEYPEFYLVTCYTPNAQRGLARIDHRMTWDEAFRAYLQRLDAVKPVILCGDLNVAHKEIDLKNPSSNRGNAGFSDQERSSFQKTLDLGFTDTFRHLHPDATGAYSWWSYMFHARENNAGWRIDYFLVSDRLKDTIYRAEIHSDILGSDHCPVSVDLGLICNGGIWSPMSQGAARQILPEGEKESPANNEPKASANSAKALVALAALFLVLLSALFLWEPAGPTDIPVVTVPPEPAIAIHVYSEPLTHVYYEILNPTYTYIVNEFQFTDGNNTFYSMTAFPEVSMSSYNTWVRVEALAPLLEQMETSASLDFVAPFGSSYKVKKLQYYTDPAYKEFGGWLLFFSLDEPAEFSFQVSTGDFTDSRLAVLTPVEIQGSILELDETSLEITTFTQPPEIDYSTSGSIRIYDYDNPFVGYANNLYPIAATADCNSWFFISLTDEAKAVIGDHPVYLSSNLNAPIDLDPLPSDGNDVFYSTTGQYLSMREVYADPDCTEPLGWFAYGNLDTTSLVTFSLRQNNLSDQLLCSRSVQSAPYLSLEAAEAMSTATLMRFVTAHSGLQNDLGILGIEPVISPGFAANLRQAYPALDVLLDRVDATSILMTTPLTDSAHRGTAHRLLDLYLRSAMTPQEQADFLTYSYANAPYIITLPGISNDPNISTYSTADIVDQMIALERFPSLLSQCSNLETAYYLFQHCQYDYYLVRLLSRQDTLEVLATLSSEAPETYSALYNFWQYLTARQQAMSMSAQTLVDAILTDEALCSTIIFTSETLLQYSYTNPLLGALSEKADAVDILMNCEPADEWAKYVPKMLLETVFFRRMTPQQTAMVITGLYPSSPEKFVFDRDYHVDDDTSFLVSYLDRYGEELYTLFDRVPKDSNYYQTCFEIYKLVVPYSDLLQRLETRDDTIAALRMFHIAANYPTSPVSTLLYLYEHYPIVDETLRTLSVLEVHGWTVVTSASSGIFYMGSSPYIYSGRNYRAPLWDATFAYFVTAPQSLMDTYSEESLALNTIICDPDDPIPATCVPCYTDAYYNHFAGWLVYGTTDVEVEVLLSLLVEGLEYDALSVTASAPEQIELE